MISIGQYGMTSSVYGCGLFQCMYEFIVCMYYGYECSFIYHVYRGYLPFMYCMCMYVCMYSISVCMVFIYMYMYIIHMYYTYVCGLVQCVCVCLCMCVG